MSNYLKLTSFLGFFLLLLCNCGGSPQKIKLGFENEIHLKHTPFEEVLQISAVDGLFILDSLIVVLNPDQGSGVHSLFTFVDPYTKTVLGQGGTVGRGPGELLNIKNVCSIAPDGKSFRVWSNISKTVAEYSCSREGEGVKFGFNRKWDVPRELASGYIDKVVQTGDDYIALTLQRKDKFYAVLDSGFNFVNYTGHPPIPEDAYDFYSRLQGFMLSDKNNFIYCPGYIPVIQCFTVNDKEARLEWEDKYYAGSYYEVREDRVIYDREKTIGLAKSLAADDEYVYLLWWPGKAADYGKSRGFDYTICAGIIYVYDRKGNRKAKLMLDKNITKLCIDKKQNKLYGVTIDPEFRIVSFDLPKSF